MFVHRTDTYVAGIPVGPGAPQGPVSKFVVRIPDGQLDDVFIPAVNRDILTALTEAERLPPRERRHAGSWASACA